MQAQAVVVSIGAGCSERQLRLRTPGSCAAANGSGHRKRRA